MCVCVCVCPSVFNVTVGDCIERESKEKKEVEVELNISKNMFWTQSQCDNLKECSAQMVK